MNSTLNKALELLGKYKVVPDIGPSVYDVSQQIKKCADDMMQTKDFLIDNKEYLLKHHMNERCFDSMIKLLDKTISNLYRSRAYLKFNQYNSYRPKREWCDIHEQP